MTTERGPITYMKHKIRYVTYDSVNRTMEEMLARFTKDLPTCDIAPEQTLEWEGLVLDVARLIGDIIIQNSPLS